MVSALVSFPTTNIHMSGQMRLVLSPWLLEWQKQNNSTYFRNVRKTIKRIIFSNIFQTSQQHCCTTAAGILQVSKVVAPTSQQALIPHFVSLYLECKQTVLWRREFACMLCIKQCTLHLKVSIFTFQRDFNTATKCVQNCVQQDRILYRFCRNVRRCTANETIQNFYIRL